MAQITTASGELAYCLFTSIAMVVKMQGLLYHPT